MACVTSSLQRLIDLVPPPRRPLGALGDRAAAQQALGWDIPAHVFEVIEAYGSVTFVGWLHQPSPFVAGDADALRARRGALERRSPGARSLIAFSDPEGCWLFVGADGGISVATRAGPTHTGLPLSEFLRSWLTGEQRFSLPSVQELTETDDIPPFATPQWDASRPSRIVWTFVKGGAPKRADRWAALRAALGPHQRCAQIGEGERRQDRVFVGDLEVDVFFDSCNRRDDVEQIHLRFYEDRKADVRARFEALLASAGMTLVKMESPRGLTSW